MQGAAETRVGQCESKIEYLMRLIRDMQISLQKAQQDARAAFAQSPVGGGGASGVFTCNPSGSIAGATGTIGTQTCASTTVVVWQCAGGAETSMGSQTVTNYLPSATVAGKQLMVIPDGSGGYGVYSQSCT